ncbi:trypsin-like peptidase domain-containing protein [Thermoflexus sp.]|uniref:S1C family serine protease n=2 Tax=Thermoflexus sp. TaxID=1969742 RepID=UPI0025E395FE|nr:trypsin-like peptidase domain-containing protein [Thermoflexus sp.]MCS7350075.1 S1C family serine protease [Thermoflexus sp.]MCX7689439.1 S1C family serine protease [Thermoflexus sp.]MDW8179524.1 trypsin-like peptidase domain-containing protein [Anaerolineae bacterium]
MDREDRNLLAALSEAMAEAVARGAAATVTVDARDRWPVSGVGYAADLVLTADHGIEREEIRVVLPDGRERSAVRIGRDPSTDLALLRVEGGSVPILEIADREPQVGQLVLALGRPGSEGIEASLGVISAIGGPLRTPWGGWLERYIRTDVTMYPGFSGGPLIDVEGRALGVNTSGLAGIPLTIPIRAAWRVAEALAREGQVRRGYLGVRTQSVPLAPAQREALGRAQARGLLIVGIEESSPAARSDLRVGDILTAFQGRPVEDAEDLQSRLMGEVVGQAVEVEVLRGEARRTVMLIVGERPEEREEMRWPFRGGPRGGFRRRWMPPWSPGWSR